VQTLVKDPTQLPVGRFIIGKSNNTLNCFRLKLTHSVVNTFPKIQNKLEVGTVSVSSLLNLDHQATDVTFVSKGPGAMSLCICGVDTASKKMNIGLAWPGITQLLMDIKG